MDRPKKADPDFFRDNRLTNGQSQTVHIDAGMACKLYQGFVRNYYVDEEDNLTEEYYQAVENGDVQVPAELQEHKEAVIELVSKIYSESATPLVQNERDKNVELKVNDNFHKAEFQKLWSKINVKTAYTVNFDTDELVERCIRVLNKDLPFRLSLLGVP